MIKDLATYIIRVPVTDGPNRGIYIVFRLECIMQRSCPSCLHWHLAIA